MSLRITTAVISSLLFAALPVSAQSGPNYLMMVSIPSGDVAKVQKALKKGADPNQGDGAPLTQAAQSYSVGVVKVLIRAGADARHVNRYGTTALWAAAGRLNARVPNFGPRRAAIARALIAAGCPVDGRNRGGMTPLHFAVMSGNFAVARVLLDAGADVNAADKKGETPMHAAARWIHGDQPAHRRFLDRLLKAGGRVDVKNAQGRTPCQVARNRYFRKKACGEKPEKAPPPTKKLILPGGGPSRK